jgi:hypothetical protein
MDKNTVTQNITKKQGDKIIHQFIQGFLDTRRNECKQLKVINLKCRRVVEKRMDQTSDLKLLLSKYENDPWIQKILVNYVLLKMYHHAALWNVEEPRPKPKKYKWLQYEGYFF